MGPARAVWWAVWWAAMVRWRRRWWRWGMAAVMGRRRWRRRWWWAMWRAMMRRGTHRVDMNATFKGLFVVSRTPYSVVCIHIRAAHVGVGRSVVVVMTGAEANVCHTPRAVSAVGDGPEDAGDAITLLELLLEVLGLLLEL